MKTVQPQRRVELMQPNKLPQDGLIFELARAGTAFLPSVVRAPGYVEQRA
jgi:hypothetical protein